MTRFVIVAAIRIQPWLTRTPTLRLLRGASAALTTFTARETIEDWISQQTWAPGEVRWADDAGEVAGVVALVVTGAIAPGTVANTLVARLRADLPGVEWSVWSGESTSYSAARLALEHDPSLATIAAPASGTAPLAMSCEGCRNEVAHKLVTIGTDAEEKYLGRDCMVRRDHGDRDHVRQYNDEIGLLREQVSTFEDLARTEGDLAAAADAYGGKRNHLATICADGNGVGQFLKIIDTRFPTHPKLREGASAALDQATKDAVAGAVHHISGSSATMAAVVHYVGGDDVFISVPAHLAWAFVLQLAQGFSIRSALEPRVGSVDFLGSVLESTSLGIGMVFAHASHPVAPAQRAAFAAMKVAKKGANGEYSAVSWLDLTGETQVAPDRFRSILELGGLRTGHGDPRAAALIALPPAARAVLAELTTDALVAWAVDRGAEPTGPTPEVVRQAVNRLRQQAVRNEQDLLADWIAKLVKAAGEPTRSTIVFRQLCWLADTLNLARWWPGVLSPSASTASVPVGVR